MFSPSAKWEETLKLIIPLNNKFSICMYHGVSISMLNITLSHITSHSSPCLLIPAALLPHSSWNYRTCEGSSKLVSGPGGTDSGAAASCPPAPTLHPSPSGSTAPTSSPWATTTPTSKVKHYCDLNQCILTRSSPFPSADSATIIGSGRVTVVVCSGALVRAATPSAKRPPLRPQQIQAG